MMYDTWKHGQTEGDMMDGNHDAFAMYICALYPPRVGGAGRLRPAWAREAFVL